MTEREQSTDPKGANYDFGADLDELDASDVAAWTPQGGSNDRSATPKPRADQVRQIAEDAGFQSREKPAPREAIDQLNIRVRTSVAEDFRDLSLRQKPRWTYGYTLERAIAALRRELEAEQRGAA